MSNPLELTYPNVALSKNDVRTKRYLLCLGMVQTIVERELNADCDSSLFYQLGTVACFIDKQLDDLSLAQSTTILNEFDQLFTHLVSAQNYSIFENHVCVYTKNKGLDFECSYSTLSQLYALIQRCKKENLNTLLSNFGKNIIRCSILKQKAKNTSEIRAILKQEGAHVCLLLESLLKAQHQENPRFKKTMRFLVDCEQILNLADDSIDAFEDKKKRLIQVKNHYLHVLKMMVYLIAQCSKTMINYPSQFLYFTPVLIGYYIRNK